MSLRPDKKTYREGGSFAGIDNQNIRFFPQAPRIKDCVRAVCHISGDNAKDPKQEKLR
jgi:hypothetical protein